MRAALVFWATLPRPPPNPPLCKGHEQSVGNKAIPGSTCLADWLAACLPACLPGCAPPPTAPMMHTAFFPVLYRSSAFGLMKPSSYFYPFFR